MRFESHKAPTKISGSPSLPREPPQTRASYVQINPLSTVRFTTQAAARVRDPCHTYFTLSTLGKPHAAQYTGRSCCPLPVGFADSRLIRRTESTLTLLKYSKRPPHEEGAELYLSPLGGGPRILTRLWIVQQRLNGVVENRQLGLLVDRPDPLLAMDPVMRSLVTVPT